MFKNVIGQKVTVYAFDSATGLPKTGDGANITAYVRKDWGAVTALTDTSATEDDATNSKGSYTFDLTQGESNFDVANFSGKSSTANIVVMPILNVQSFPNRFGTFVIDAAGLGDANMVKAGPTGAGAVVPAGAIPNAVAGAAGGLGIAGSNAATTYATLTVTGATTLTGALTSTNASNDLRLGPNERGLIRDKVGERVQFRCTVGSGSTTTSIVTSAMSPATTDADQLLGQILMFDFDTTTAGLRGQKTAITASSASATPTLTVAATTLTRAPASGDTFTIG